MSKQLTLLIILIATLLSAIGGYMLAAHSTAIAVQGSDQVGLLARFDGIPSPTATPIPDGLVRLSADAALSAANDSASDSVLYYHRADGTVTKIGLADHASTQISATMLPHLSRIIWSADGTQVLAVYNLKTGPTFKYFNYQTHQTATLGNTIIDAAFSPDGTSIVMAKTLTDETDIVIAKPDGSDASTILKTHLSDISLAWPADHAIAMTVGNTDGTSDLYTVSDQGDLEKILAGQSNLETQWSPDGSVLLYSSVQQNQPALALHAAGGEDQAVAIAADANRCAWYLNGAAFVCLTDDGDTASVREVSATNLASKILVPDLVDINPERVFLSQLQDFMVLVDRADHSLWSIRLPH